MEIEQLELEYNPFSKENRERHFFKDGKHNVTSGIINIKQWYYQTYKELLELVLGRFEWEGLPENMPLYYLEKKLIHNGSALIYETELEGLFVGTGARSQELNHYEESTGYSVVSPIGAHNKTYTLGVDGVMIKNNSDATPDVDLIKQYALLQTEIRTTQTVNLLSMRYPFLLNGNEKTKTSIVEQFNQLRAGSPWIFVDPELETEQGHTAERVFNTNTPYNIDQLQQFYNDIKNELLTQLGVNTNPSQDKKERLLVDEISSNDDETSAYIQTRLEERKLAAKRANDLFGTNISVELAESFQPGVRESGMSNVNYLFNSGAGGPKEGGGV